MQTAFITGCGSGFGQHLARRLLEEDGWRVVATNPNIDGLRDRLLPDEGAKDRLRIFALDVKVAERVRQVTREAHAWSPVDVLVNNAGYAIFGTQEEADLEAVRDLLDVNVLGPARVTQALLPVLRERRGTVVQLSSVAGRTVFPESGFYAATKHAVEAMSEALFQEACTFGVRVRLIQPGTFDTRFLERAKAASRPRSADSPYAHLHETWDARRQEILEPPQDPREVAEAILQSLSDPAPFLRVPVGPDARRLLTMRASLTPDGWVHLAAQRVRYPCPPSPHGAQILSPEELLALVEEAPPDLPDRLRPHLQALAQGHLGHWPELPGGHEALAVLEALAKG